MQGEVLSRICLGLDPEGVGGKALGSPVSYVVGFLVGTKPQVQVTKY